MSNEQPITTLIESMLKRHPNGVLKMPPGIAKRITEECSFLGQRDIKAFRVKKHADTTAKGEWKGAIHPIVFAKTQDGRLILVNGHHRCEFIAQHDAALEIMVIIQPVKDEHEARALYKQFDDPTSARTVSEVLDAEQMPLKMGLGKDNCKFTFNALAAIRSGFDLGAKSTRNTAIFYARDRAEVMGEMPDWKNEAHTYFQAVNQARPAIAKKMRGAGCMAVGLYTLRHQSEKAREFWIGLAKNDGLRATDPRSALIADFSTRVRTTGSKAQIVIAPATAWNAWFEGRDLKIIKVSQGASLRIAGTPWAKGAP